MRRLITIVALGLVLCAPVAPAPAQSGISTRQFSTGTWGDLSPSVLDAQAHALGPAMNQTLLLDEKPSSAADPAFKAYSPPPMER